jgi:hypothetical protein
VPFVDLELDRRRMIENRLAPRARFSSPCRHTPNPPGNVPMDTLGVAI